MNQHEQKLSLLREIAHFQNADQSIIIWTLEHLSTDSLKGFKTLVAFPKHDHNGYITVARADTEEEALFNHRQIIKKMILNKNMRSL